MTYASAEVLIDGKHVDVGKLDYHFDMLEEVVAGLSEGLTQSFTTFTMHMRTMAKGYAQLLEAMGMHHRSSATVATLEKRAKYNNRKGRAARRKLA